MKKAFLLVLAVALVLCFSGMSSALTFYDKAGDDRWISTSGSDPAPNGWFELDFPDWYDSNLVSFFQITLIGKYDNSSKPINLFIDNDSDHSPRSEYLSIGSYDVENRDRFSLTMDIVTQDLLYNGRDVGDLSHVDLTTFDGWSELYVGYGCHFKHLKTFVEITQNPVPEPTTLLLLGTGLAGLAGLKRRKRK